MSNFQRENRYIVIKRKHLSSYVERAIQDLLIEHGVDTVECVVVESDWPEYEPTWKAIQDRMETRERIDFLEKAKKAIAEMPPIEEQKGFR